ncbi:MAG TPA: epoxyqueuosine reductase QueH [Candidatus Caccenecus avistercoris]|nr:epoxyqueuosine reductase QueH [Candidatus Caccenecus avistercoris]
MKPKINYQKKLEELVSTFTSKPKLLLHSCCGPCSTEVIDFLKDYFEITVFYYNPNIEPVEEYLHRKTEQIRFLKEYKEAEVDFLDCDYDNSSFKEIAKGLEHEKEGGARCNKCFYLRMYETAKKAKDLGFAYFGTTLTVSPHKNSMIINEIGEHISGYLKISYIYGDFKKNDGYKKSIEFSKIYNLYRQDYCGCLYGKE